jgi:signal transduction histidine kinase
MLAASSFRSSFLPGPPSRAQEFEVPLEGARWHLKLEAEPALELARRRAASVRSDFRRLFWSGLVAAIISASSLVILVWQTERLAQRRSQLAASAAHELRTPLAGLRMYSEMLAEGQGQAARSKEYAERIAAEAERLGRVVSNLLGFARLERGNRTVRAEPGDLGQAVAASVERQRAILESAGLRVEGVISRGLAPVVFDRDAIDEIMANLLDNAEKHTRSVPNRFVRVELSEEATGVMLSVTDNGPGIPQSLRRRLFRPFARDGRPGGVGGLGLGLALTRSLVQAQGADWMVAAAPGGGARFTICFPKRGPAG